MLGGGSGSGFLRNLFVAMLQGKRTIATIAHGMAIISAAMRSAWGSDSMCAIAGKAKAQDRYAAQRNRFLLSRTKSASTPRARSRCRC